MDPVTSGRGTTSDEFDNFLKKDAGSGLDSARSQKPGESPRPLPTKTAVTTTKKETTVKVPTL